MADLKSNPKSKSLPSLGSPLALGGLVWGVGVLDAVEVLRYMDATFRRYAEEEEGRQDEQV